MKHYTSIFILVFAFQLLFSSGFALDYKAKQPILITSAGQSADVLMVKILAKKSGLKFTFDKSATPEKLKDHATLILVSGGSTKGLGAAKTDKRQELKRIQTLIDAAKKAKLSIITMHLGGKARRGKLSDEFNKLAAENADCLVVVKSGDEGQFFSKIAKEKKISIELIEKIMEAGAVMKGIFSAPVR